MKTANIKLIPVIMETNGSLFVDKKDVEPKLVMVEDVSVLTSPLSVNTRIDLCGISQTNELLEHDVVARTDSVAIVKVLNVYVKLLNTVLCFDTSNLVSSSFVPDSQNRQGILELNLIETLIVNAEDIRKVIPDVIITDGYQLGLRVTLTGTAYIECSDIIVNFDDLFTVNLNGEVKNNEEIAIFNHISNVFSNAVVIGYDLGAERITNSPLTLGV